MDAEQIATLRILLSPTGWVERAAEFARALRRSPAAPGGLLLVGTADHEPWHLAAHLDEESRFAGIPELTPTLIRWTPPAGAPAHLRVGPERLSAARKGESLLVVSPQAVPAPLLERVDDARRGGAAVFALDRGDPELAGLAHETLAVTPGAGLSFDAAQHLVSAAAGEQRPTSARGLRARLGRLLESVSGPPPPGRQTW